MATGFSLPDPYEAQKQEIARRQAYAQALQQQAVQPIEPLSFQGFQAPISGAAVLAKALQGLGGGLMSAQAEQRQRELSQADIAKGQEFAAALQGAKTPEERQSLATRALGGDFGARGQAMASPVFTMAEAAKERDIQRQWRESEAERARAARADEAEARRQIQLMQLQQAGQIAATRADIMRQGVEARITTQQEKAKELSPQEQRQVFQQQDQIDAGQSTLSLLSQAKDLSDKFKGGVGAGTAAYIGSQARSLVGMAPSEENNALINYDNLVKEQALSQLKTTFGGNPTEGERKVLLELQASSGKTPEQRTDILNRAMALAQQRIVGAEQRRDAVITKTYKQPGAAAPTQPAPSESITAVDAQGNRIVLRNGRWEPMR